MKMKISCLLLLLFVFVTSWAQNPTVSGDVMKQNGEALAGATVKVKGTNTATTTDEKGHYAIKVPNLNVTLVFTYVGNATQEVAVNGKTTVTVVMREEASSMDEVVVVGYGKVRKKDLTGTVAVLSGKDLAKVPVSSAAEAMTGKMAGVQVTTSEGSPDADIKIRVRGGGSISQDNSPLYIVDGFPVNSLNDVSPSDIATISVLKDGATTAIYGAKGANGVVLITTKEGSAGKVTVTANAYAGVRRLARQLDVLSPYEYVKYQYELDQASTFQNYYGNYQDLDIYKSVKGTNWQDKIFGQNGTQQYYNVGVSGGSKTTRFNLGLTRNDEKSIMVGSGFQRNNLSFKLNSDISNKFSFDFNTRLAFTVIDGAGVSSGSGANTRLRNSVKYAPTKGIREFSVSTTADDDLSNPESASLLYNPVQSTNDEYKNQRNFSNNFNAGVNWKIINNLTYRAELGYEFNNGRTDYVWGPATAKSKTDGAGQPIAQLVSINGNSWRIANTLNYDFKEIIKNRDHSLTTLLGQEATSSSKKTITSNSRFFPADMNAEDVLAMMNLGKADPTVTKEAPDDRMSSYFGRLNYAYTDRYLLAATFRADGSSKFRPGNQWGFFPSVAAAWRLSSEKFFPEWDWVQDLKLRASVGSAGNNRIDPGLWMFNYTTDNDNKPYYLSEIEASQLIPSTSLANPDLKWETTFTRNAGLDFSLFKSKLTGAFDFYYNTTKDLLVQAPIPTSSGYATQYRNMGQTSNKGIELTLDGTVIRKKDFFITANFNISRNWNNIDKYQNGDKNYKTYTSGWNGTAQPLEDYIVQEGRPVGQMYGYVTEGMYSFDDFTFNSTTQKWDLNKGVADNSGLTSATYFGPGALKFKDISGPDGTPDGKIDSYDKTIIGNANPKFTGGFGLNAGFKGFDLSALFNWVYGNNIYNANKIDFTTYLSSRKYQNILSIMDLDHRFTIIDPLTGNNVATGKNANPERLRAINENATIWSPLMTVTPLHSWAIEDGSFLRLNTLTLGYTIPKEIVKKGKIQNLRVYVTGYNLFVATNYSGYDPEVDTRRNPPLTPGVDYSAYPKSRSFVGGINVTF